MPFYIKDPEDALQAIELAIKRKGRPPTRQVVKKVSQPGAVAEVKDDDKQVIAIRLWQIILFWKKELLQRYWQTWPRSKIDFPVGGALAPDGRSRHYISLRKQGVFWVKKVADKEVKRINFPLEPAAFREMLGQSKPIIKEMLLSLLFLLDWTQYKFEDTIIKQVNPK